MNFGGFFSGSFACGRFWFEVRPRAWTVALWSLASVAGNGDRIRISSLFRKALYFATPKYWSLWMIKLQRAACSWSILQVECWHTVLSTYQNNFHKQWGWFTCAFGSIDALISCCSLCLLNKKYQMSSQWSDCIALMFKDSFLWLAAWIHAQLSLTPRNGWANSSGALCRAAFPPASAVPWWFMVGRPYTIAVFFAWLLHCCNVGCILMFCYRATKANKAAKAQKPKKPTKPQSHRSQEAAEAKSQWSQKP